MSLLNNQIIIPFLCKAKKATYAGKGPEKTPSRPGSHDLQYEDGNYKYIDSYLGGKRFSGEEAVWENGIPIWAMNYSGRVINKNFNGDFLREVLLHVPEGYPYRGPLNYQKGDYTYHCTVNGQFEWFQGFEAIFYNDIKVYECYFHGGVLVS